MIIGALPRQPANVTVTFASPTSVLVSWQVNTDDRTHYEITYKPLQATYKVVAEVDGGKRSVLLERLQPTTRYEVHVTPVNAAGIIGNASHTVLFDTSSQAPIEDHHSSASTASSLDHAPFVTGSYTAKGEEIGIVVLVLALWVFVLLLFFNKWGKIRMLEPYQPQYKQARAGSCQMLHGQRKDSHITLDQMHLSMSALFERDRIMSMAHIHRCDRPRQNSVFVPNVFSAINQQNARKVKSAEDLNSITLKCNDETIDITAM